LALIDELGTVPDLASYYLYHAARADILRRLGRADKALEEYKLALPLTTNVVEQRYLSRRINELTKQ
jgi:RNA polymerase sigma-70 factor, ECF subfamily